MSEEKIKSIIASLLRPQRKVMLTKQYPFVLTMWSGSSPKVHSKERMR